jgi:hypothetical protein
MNRNKTVLAGIVCTVMLLSLGTSWGANRYFFSPETLKVGPGASFSWTLMMECDVQLCGYGFGYTAVDEAPPTIFDPNDLTGDYTGSAQQYIPGLTDFSYSPTLYVFGGFAATGSCPPGVPAGTHIAITLSGTVAASTPFGVYTFSETGNNSFTDENLGNIIPTVETGYLEVIPHNVHLNVVDCPADSIEEDVTVVITADAGCSDPGHTGTLTCLVNGTDPLPSWATFVVTGTNPYVGTLTLEPTVATGPYEEDFVFKYVDDVTMDELTETCHIKVYDSVPRPAWLLEFKKRLANPGQQHVCVPVFLSALEPVNAFEILFDYDPTAVTFVGVSDICSGCEELWVHPCDALDRDYFELKTPLFYYNSETDNYRPEYFHYTHGVGSHPNWVRVVGIMDMDWPQPITPPFDGAQQMIFCVIFDVSPLWDGQEVFSYFKITDCTDNTVTDPTGYDLFGPTADELPGWLDCNFDSVIVLWDGADGCPIIGIRDVLAGDLNCNEIQCEVGDAVVFINYLVEGVTALCGEACEDMYGDNCAAAQGYASDMNDDGYYWTIADLVALLNCVNGYVTPPAAAPAGPVDVMMTTDEVKVSSDVELGAAYFTVEYEGDATPVLNVPGMEMEYHGADGVMNIVIYSMELNRIPAGSHTLFTLPGINSITKADLADGAGNTLGVSVFNKPAAGFAIQRIVPNPVRNATADIFFSVPVTGEATLRVYDSAGRLITTLVDGTAQRGLQKATWDARDHSNGVYFCRLENDSRTATKKIVLMK